MPHDIIDNRNEHFVNVIHRILPGSEAAKFSVGYIFLSGLEAVADVLANVQELHLLIGNTSSRETIEQIAEGYRRLEQASGPIEEEAYLRRIDRQRRVQETATAVGAGLAAMDQTDQAEAFVATHVRLIRDGRLQVRVYTRGRLDSKAYIFGYGPVYDQAGNQLSRQERGIAVVV